MGRIRIRKNEDQPESTEVLAAAIIKIGDGMEKLTASGLNKKAIIVLIQDQVGGSKGDIEKVLDALQQLKGWYCK